MKNKSPPQRGALLWWRVPQKSVRHLPAEHFGGAIRAGFRYARHNPHLRATLMRATGFFLFGSAYWALLPLVARTQIAGEPDLHPLETTGFGGSARAAGAGRSVRTFACSASASFARVFLPQYFTRYSILIK